MVLVNSNPATIMTDPEHGRCALISSRSTWRTVVGQVIEKEKTGCVLLPTMGGQTAPEHGDLTWTVKVCWKNMASKMIGANKEAIDDGGRSRTVSRMPCRKYRPGNVARGETIANRSGRSFSGSARDRFPNNYPSLASPWAVQRSAASPITWHEFEEIWCAVVSSQSPINEVYWSKSP